MDRNPTNSTDKEKEIRKKQTERKSRQWQGPELTYPSIQTTIENPNNLDNKQVLDRLRQYKWQTPHQDTIEQEILDLSQKHQQDELFKIADKNFERREKVETYYNKFTDNGMQFIFPEEFKKYKELIDNCDKCHDNIMGIQTSSPLPETNYDPTLYEKHKEVHSDFSQAITKTETFQQLIDKKISEQNEEAHKSIESLYTDDNIHKLPKYVRDYAELDWMIYKTFSNFEEERIKLLNSVITCQDNELRTEKFKLAKDYIISSTTNQGNRERIELMLQTSEFISSSHNATFNTQDHKRLAEVLDYHNKWPERFEQYSNFPPFLLHIPLIAKLEGESSKYKPHSRFVVQRQTLYNQIHSLAQLAKDGNLPNLAD